MKSKIKIVLGFVFAALDGMLVATIFSTWVLLNLIVIVPKVLDSGVSEWKIKFVILLLILMPIYGFGRYIFSVLTQKKKEEDEKH